MSVQIEWVEAHTRIRFTAPYATCFFVIKNIRILRERANDAVCEMMKVEEK